MRGFAALAEQASTGIDKPQPHQKAFMLYYMKHKGLTCVSYKKERQQDTVIGVSPYFVQEGTPTRYGDTPN